MNLARPLHHPVFWLLAQSAFVFLLLEVSGSLEPRLVPDTASYLQVAEAPSMRQALVSHRTLGYPAFFRSLGLRADGEINGSHSAHAYRVFQRVPTIQALVFLAAVLLLWFSIRAYTGSGWLAFAFATPLYYVSIWRLVDRIQPDFLGAALALISVALLVLLVSQPRRTRWIALTMTVFAAYLVRPGYVFLVPLIPAIGVVLHFAKENRRLARSLVFGLGLLGVTLLPFLSFSALRWSQVRDFGLVSFGGYNLIGVSTSLLDQNIVDNLSRNQAVAEAILRDREGRGWSPMSLGSDIREWHSQHNPNVWRISVGHAFRRLQAQQEIDGPADPNQRHFQIEINRIFKELSWDIIQRKPWHYAQWVRHTFVETLSRAAKEPGIRWPAMLIVLSLPVLLLTTRLAASSGGGMPLRQLDRILALCAMSAAYFAVHATTVALVSLPYSRFLYAMVLILPSALCATLFVMWRSIAVALEQRGLRTSAIGFPVVVVAALVFGPNAVHLYKGAVTRTTAEAASTWIERDAGFLMHRTIATEGTRLGIRSRDSNRQVFVPLQLVSAELSELPSISLDLSDYEVFEQSRLIGPDRDFYKSRLERPGAVRVQTFEARAFRRTGPTLVVLAHPWRVRTKSTTGTGTPVTIEWQPRGARRLLGTLGPRFKTGQVVSFDLGLTPQQSERCTFEVDGTETQLHSYTRNGTGSRHMTTRLLLKRSATPLRLRCSERGLIKPVPTVEAILWRGHPTLAG